MVSAWGRTRPFCSRERWTRFTVVVDSELDSKTLSGCHLHKGDAQQTLDTWFEELRGQRLRVAVVPNANTTYFYGSGQ